MHISKGSEYFRLKALAAGAMLMATSAAVNAAENPATDWEYGLSIYGWLPNLGGELSFAPPGVSDEIHVDVDQLIDDLQMTFMGSFEVRKGPWSGFTDVIYLNLGGDESKSVSLPDGSTRVLVDADLDITGWIWTLGGSYFCLA